MLYGSELWQLTNSEVETLEVFQRNKIKQLQGLPSRTSNVAALGLMGILPVQAEINKRVLTLFRNLVHDTSSLEYGICLRQLALKLALKSPRSRSLLTYGILSKYGLPSAQNILLDTPSKLAWKATVRDAINPF